MKAAFHEEYKQGWLTGYAVTTIAIEVATAGAGTAVTQASKSAVLAKVAPKFAKFGGKFAKGTQGGEPKGTFLISLARRIRAG